jgi:EmrB/QacA subfamily drug resistance transporter
MADSVAEAPAQPEEEVLERRHWITILLTSVGVLMVVMDSTIVNVALPIIREDLGFLEVSVSELQWVVNAYALSFAVLLLSAGKLADLFGRKRLFLIGLVIFTGASAACGAANEINVLIGFRAVQGIGAALIMPTTLSIIQTQIPMSKLGIAIGIWSGIVGLGTAIGPLAGGVLAEQVDWRWVFFINIPVGVAVFLGTLVNIPESRSDLEDRRLDVVGALISAVSLFAITYALLKANEFGWGDPRTLGFLAGGVVGLAVFIVYERGRPYAMLDLGLFRSTSFSGANVVAVFVGFALFGLLFFGSLFIQSIMGFSATDNGLSQLPMMAMIVLFGPRVGKLVGKVGPGPLLAVGMVLLAVSFLLFYRLDFDSDFWTLLPAMIVGGIGFAFVLTPLTAAALSSVPFQQAGMGAACINSTRQIGGALGLAVMGAISAELVSAGLLEGKASPDAFVDGFGVLMLTGAGISVAGALVAWITIAQPARAAKAAAAAAAAAAPPEPAVAAVEPTAEAPAVAAAPQEVQVEYSQNWALAAPSVVSALPESLVERAAAARGGGPSLQVLEGPAAGLRIPIEEEPLVLGRGETGVGTLGDDPQLSRRHASVARHDDGGLLVEDLGSTNGTLVNGEEISGPTPVKHGDKVEAGSTIMRVIDVPQRPAPPAPDGLVVEVVEGPATGAQIRIGSAPFVFGRAEPGDGSLGDDPELSRRHASASLFAPGRLLLEDLGSTNGTYVNDHRIAAPTVVSAGDGLRLGTSALRVAGADGVAR